MDAAAAAPPLLRPGARGRPQLGRLPRPAAAALVRAAGMTYAELHAHSCYSFLDGASQPIEVAERAAELGYDAFALTDHDSLCGSMEFARAARDAGLRPITGCELTLTDGSHVTLLAEDERGYRNLCRLVTLAHADDRRTPAGDARTARGPRRGPALPVRLRPRRARRPAGRRGQAARGRGRRPDAAGDVRPRAVLDRAAAPLLARRRPPQPAARRAGRAGCGSSWSPPATRTPTRSPAPILQDALVAIRMNTTLDACERHRRGNHEAVLRSPAETAARFPAEAVHGAERGRRALPLRPHPRPRLPLPRLRVGDRRVGPGRPRTASASSELERRYAGLPHMHEARARLERGAGADRPPRPGRLLPAAPRHPGAGARGRGAGARRQRRPPAAAARPRPRLQRRLDRLLPDRPLPRRPGRDPAVPGPLPVARAGERARHRPRLPARRPRGADPRGAAPLRRRPRRAGRRLPHLPRARRDPRPGQGAGAAPGRDRADGADVRRLRPRQRRRRPHRPAARLAPAGAPSAS